MPASLGELATEFGCDLVGDPDTRVDRVATLANASPQSIGFLANPAYRNQLEATKAAAVVLAEADADDCPVAALICEDPYTTYARIAGRLHPPAEHSPGIHSSALVDASTTVSDSAHISANVVIGKDCSIADGVFIGAGCVLGDRCSVGANARILSNATLVDDIRIGERCIIHPGAVVGSDGFGHARSDSGWIKVPQIGGVLIGDDVEVGANTAIDCARNRRSILQYDILAGQHCFTWRSRGYQVLSSNLAPAPRSLTIVRPTPAHVSRADLTSSAWSGKQTAFN
jgi:UDP-3-O-[3-hydroxymyristoyl] glucosamine N-acyltransferase